MKGKVVTFRPSIEMRARLERLALATGHKLTFHIEAAIKGHLPELERRYARELRELSARDKVSSSKGSLRKVSKALEEGVKKLDPPPEGSR